MTTIPTAVTIPWTTDQLQGRQLFAGDSLGLLTVQNINGEVFLSVQLIEDGCAIFRDLEQRDVDAMVRTSSGNFVLNSNLLSRSGGEINI